MSLITRALSAIGLEKRSTLGVNGWPQVLGSGAVTPSTAQSVSAVYACVSAISETVASLPLILFRKTADGDRERASDHPLYRVLHDQANSEQTALEFRELMQANVLLRGNAFAKIVRGWDGQVRELLPIHPDTMQVRRINGALVYDYSQDGTMHRLLNHEVLHLRHRIGDDGILGVSPIAVARGTVELAMAERDHGVSTFNNGAKLLGVLKFPGVLKDTQRTAIAASWASQHAGSANSGRTAILESGVEFQAVSINMQDAQWLESRQFSVEEIARLFRVPPTVIGDLRHGNYSNSVEMARQFVTQSLRRHLVSWEQAISAKCLTEAGRRTYFAEHAVEGLLRGDSTTRAAFYASGIASGYMLPSEARRLENLPDVPGIDERTSTTTAPASFGNYPSKQV